MRATIGAHCHRVSSVGTDVSCRERACQPAIGAPLCSSSAEGPLSTRRAHARQRAPEKASAKGQEMGEEGGRSRRSWRVVWPQRGSSSRPRRLHWHETCSRGAARGTTRQRPRRKAAQMRGGLGGCEGWKCGIASRGWSCQVSSTEAVWKVGGLVGRYGLVHFVVAVVVVQDWPLGP